MKSPIWFAAFLLFVSGTLFGANNPEKVRLGIDEQLGKTIPLSLSFINDEGKPVVLKDLVNKPTIFMFVYFECPGICTPLMNEVADEITKIDLEPGKDYQIVSVSIDSREGYTLAADKKANYLSNMKGAFPPSAWQFLTGDSASVHALSDAMGFYFKQEGDDFIHAGGLMFVSAKGKITRYLLGTDFLPFDMKMAVLEASEGRVTPTIAKMLKFCYSYDAEGKRYALNITRIVGVGMLLLVAVFVIYLTAKPKKKDTINKD